MTNKPRKHHFVPQFWIRKFVGPDGKLWTYDHQNGCIRERSPKQLMQIFNLYTLQPSGIDDTTLETVDLGEVDTQGSRVFERILNGDQSPEARGDLANFLAVQILRDPDVVTTYNPKAQELTLSLLSAVEAPDFESFLQRWQSQFPGAYVTEDEYKYIQSLGLKDGEDAIEKIITALDAGGGLPELPFTDVMRSPDSRKIVSERLLGLEWTIRTDHSGRFILGDCGVLFNKGDSNYLSVPLSRNVALYMTATQPPADTISSILAKDYEVESLNAESAARSRRWIVGDREELERLQSQVGTNPLPV